MRRRFPTDSIQPAVQAATPRQPSWVQTAYTSLALSSTPTGAPETPLRQSLWHTSSFECVSLKGIHEYILKIALSPCLNTNLQRQPGALSAAVLKLFLTVATDLLFLSLIKDLYFHTEKMYLSYLNTNIINYVCCFSLCCHLIIYVLLICHHVLTSCKLCGVTQINTFL